MPWAGATGSVFRLGISTQSDPPDGFVQSKLAGGDGLEPLTLSVYTRWPHFFALGKIT
jgi:hypothetical protein